MSSPRDIPVLSSSPISVRGSPIARRRRDSGSQSDSAEPSFRTRQPVYPLSVDHNDPDSRERQRAMDVDMALQLSRARRESIVSPSNYDPTLREEVDPSFLLTTSEQHALGFARDDGIHPFDQDAVGRVAEEPLHTALPADAELRNLDQTHNHILLDTMEGRYQPAHREDASASMTGLPSYQANSSRVVFDFTHLESFASEEKANQSITPNNEAPLPRYNKPAGGQVSDAGKLSSQADLPMTGGESSDAPLPSNPRIGGRHRKLSQSSPVPRSSRRGTRGKMALFDSRYEPSPRFPAHLMPDGQLSTVPSSDNLSTICQPYAPENLISVGGIMAPVDDRPYRFSFYSNSLSATIHARNLCELPAEGQSFQDLFTGISTPPEGSAFREGPPGGQSNSNSNRRGEKPLGDPGKPSGSSSDYEANTWWLDVLSPTDEEMNVLSKVFGIHPLTTEDIQMEETREKIELFRNYYFVCFRSFDQDPYGSTYLEPLNMYIVVFREGILSFHFRPTPHPQNVRRRIKQLKDYINVTSDWISYALIDDITDAFGPLIQSIECEVDSIDELVLILKDTEQSDMLRRIGRCRRKVLGLLRLMGNKADVVKGLAKRCNENWRVAPTSDIGLYLSDIQDHLITMTQNLNHYEKILSRSHSNYLAQISIEMTDANNQINDVLSKLTALGTVLIPMNLVTGLWGMNVHVPGQDITEGYAWFSSIVAALAAFAVIGAYTTYKFMRR
ncbi:hypothetical protein EDD16DRAFT_1883208 [Pisolithus croceorrhizus]|nr:hypothetical protein EV401DRAFT_2216658 [Pisolithus croceorrhizus]KAI6127390.1 hypothetical protein EDD16DRAFT_1883208 [Pisolithus croceorrhizus]